MAMARVLALSLIVLAGLAAFARAPAYAKSYPARPFRSSCRWRPAACGHARPHLVAAAGWASGQPVVVENRPGGAGAVGAEAAARSPADGYTLFMGSLATNAVIASLTKLSFDPNKDLVPVIHVATFRCADRASRPAGDGAPLVAYARAIPGGLSYASQGNAASGHLVG